MQKRKREKMIIELLLEWKNGLTGEEIARQVGVSSRTIRSDMKALQEKMQPLKSYIIAMPNKGYRLVRVEKTEDILRFISKKEGAVGFANVEEQRNYMISQFLLASFSNSSITYGNLAEKMYVGISTIKKLMLMVRKRFAEYSLRLEKYRTEGMRLIGSESNMRSFLVDYLHEVQDAEIRAKLFDKISEAALGEILLQIESVRNLQLTDRSRMNLSTQVALAVCRSKQEHILEYPVSMAQKLEDTFEYGAAKEIANELFRYAGIDLPYGEVFYLTQCLLTGKKLMNLNGMVNDVHIADLVTKVLAEVDAKFGLDFTADQYLKDGLMLHLRIAIARVHFHMTIRNDLLESVKQDYPLAFQIAVYAAKVLKDLDHIDFDENEIGYIALHFGASISRNNMVEEQPKRVYVVCSAGLGVSILLKAKLKEYFRDSLQVIGVLPAYKLTEKMIHEADYILSTVPLGNSSDKIIRVNHMLRQEDVERITRVVFHKESALSCDLVRSFFRRDSFYVDKGFETREACLEFLTDKAIEAGFMDLAGKRSVFERERLSSTAIGSMAAIPHSMVTENHVSHISVLLLKHAIDWGDMKVRVVFLLNIEQAKADLWEKVFLKLYAYIKNRNGVESLLAHKSYDSFIEEFESIS